MRRFARGFWCDNEQASELDEAEALFKALARALRTAVELDPRRKDVASTKGTLTK